jgi:hypothetical protein
MYSIFIDGKEYHNMYRDSNKESVKVWRDYLKELQKLGNRFQGQSITVRKI